MVTLKNIPRTQDNTYDYVIVGAGPSCAGLVRGLLTAQKQQQQQQQQASSSPPLPQLRIAVIERGPVVTTSAEDTARVSPSEWFQASHSKNHPHAVLLHGTTSQGRVFDVPTGQGLDGTTNIHACLCIPPSQHDFRGWPEPYQRQLLATCQDIQHIMYERNCLSQNPCTRFQDDNSSSTGPNPGRASSNHQQPPLEWTETVFPSSPNSIPMTVTADTTPIITKECAAKRKNSELDSIPRRSSYWDGLVFHTHDNLDLQHLTIVHGHVERLLIEDGDEDTSMGPAAPTRRPRRRRVMGVDYRDSTTTNTNRTTDDLIYQQLWATRDVIVCAGAIETPALLLVSGISSTAKSCLPIGLGLYDHVSISRATLRCWGKKLPTTVNGLSSLDQFEIDSSYFQVGIFEGTAYSDILPHVVAGWVRYQWKISSRLWYEALLVRLANRLMALVHQLLRWLLRIVLCQYSPLYWFVRKYVITITLFLLNPTSTGQITIRPKAKTTQSTPTLAAITPPVTRRSDVEVDIHLGYLEDEKDVRALHKGWLASQVLFPAEIEVFPGMLVKPWQQGLGNGNPVRLDSDRFRHYCRATCLPYFHWCGSCRMDALHEKHGQGVVDAALRVHGHSGLRICDASVFPTTISAPTALTCVALGYLFGTSILTQTNNACQR